MCAHHCPQYSFEFLKTINIMERNSILFRFLVHFRRSFTFMLCFFHSKNISKPFWCNKFPSIKSQVQSTQSVFEHTCDVFLEINESSANLLRTKRKWNNCKKSDNCVWGEFSLKTDFQTSSLFNLWVFKLRLRVKRSNYIRKSINRLNQSAFYAINFLIIWLNFGPK